MAELIFNTKISYCKALNLTLQVLFILTHSMYKIKKGVNYFIQFYQKNAL